MKRQKLNISTAVSSYLLLCSGMYLSATICNMWREVRATELPNVRTSSRIDPVLTEILIDTCVLDTLQFL